ncbi:MAG TPA: OmpA family protein [Fibrobacteraceae bacterium]|nr:OmpA family protein [Fibrobacteraceae bacterium]
MKKLLILSLSLFSFIWAAGLQPTKDLAVLNVTATDPQGHAQKEKTIIFQGLHNGQKIEGRTDSRGEFSIHLPKGEAYSILFMSLSGPYPCGEVNVPLNAGVGNWSVEFDESVYELKDVLFETGKSTLKPSSFKQLDLLVEGLNKYDTLNVEIAGHTDNVGGEEYNMELSQARAESVRNYLLQKHIASDRVVARGYGYSQPVADNGTEEGRARNRRTEVRILNLNQNP